MDIESLMGEHRPELTTRRGELFAWITALLALVGWLILELAWRRTLPGVPFLTVFLWLAAMSISLGNWMDRRSRIVIQAEGIIFDNGLRHAELVWGEINQVQVFDSQWGRKVRVVGEKAHFDFRTLGEVKVQGQVKGRLGFAHGEAILQLILECTGLKEIEHTGNGTYYAR
jgi:hypothetical protein